jgi:hypothetical protein
MTDSTKMKLVKEIYDRPTSDQAIVEVLKDYIRIYEPERTATAEALVVIAREQVEAEAKRRDDPT